MLTNIFGYAQDRSNKENTVRENPIESNLDSLQQSTVKNSNAVLKADTVVVDSIINDSISKPKSFLEATVNYTAKDYTSVNQ